MKKIILTLFLFVSQYPIFAQLTVEKIMRDPVWIGISPSEVRWSEDSKQIYFEWKTEKDTENFRYQTDFQGNNLQKLDKNIEKNLPNPQGKFSKDRSKKLYVKHGDIFLVEIATNKITQITNTSETESDPNFLTNDKIVFQRSLNLFTLNLKNAYLEQITDFVRGSEPKTKAKSEGEKWLENDQLNWFQVLKERNLQRKKDAKEAENEKPKRPTKIYLEDKNISLLQLSPNEKFVSYRLSKFIENVPTKVPNYVTESGYTEDLPTRAKVGTESENSEFWIADLEKNTYSQLNLDSLTGLYDQTDFEKERNISRKTPRKVVVNGIFWSDDAKKAVAVIRSFDNKDRWIAAVDFAQKTVQTLDRQRDEAWIGGACIGSWYLQTGDLGWINSENIWFVSEQTAYSHLYTLNVQNLQKKAITQGNFEVRKVQISADKRKFYFVSSEIHAGEDHLYVCDIDGKNKIQLTQMTGGHEVFISPNEQQIAFLYSYSNKPWELFVMENKANAKPKQITFSLTEEFKNYAWRDPQIVTFKAGDGKEVFARLYKPKPENDKKAGVIFVHGAGYLQNAHKHWSSYFREYMFHNLLTDKGFTVLDIDYRGSAGYGRDWRTGIYRFMGGQDLNDHIDGAKYLVEKHGVDAKKMGIYGGSYGGFITLMAMFTKPDVFAAGAALRSVTDWAHYNHGYTNNILNTPVADSLSFAKSSPIYYAEGLKGALLICHGMIDTNVHFQDVVRLAQRLIELKKENWEFAVYPLEDHGFVEPSSWTDEYKRILKLFETHLK